MMYETLTQMLALITGVFLGAVFFGGLWWTVREGISSRHPALLFLASLLLRTSVTLAGFYFIGRGHWERLVICLFGFVIARFIVMRMTRPSSERQIRPAQETSHAP